MSNYGLRHEPHVIAIAIISTLFSGRLVKKILEESNIEINDRTLRRAKQDLKELGIDILLQELNKVYQFSILTSFIDCIKLKKVMFDIVNNNETENSDKIKAAELILKISGGIPDLMDPLLSKSINDITDNASKKNSDESLQEGDAKVGPCRIQPQPDTEAHEGVDSDSTKENQAGTS